MIVHEVPDGDTTYQCDQCGKQRVGTGTSLPGWPCVAWAKSFGAVPKVWHYCSQVCKQLAEPARIAFSEGA